MSLRPGDELAGFARVDAFLREDRGGVRFTGSLIAADAKDTKVEIYALGSRGEEDATELGVRFLAAARRASTLEHRNIARALRAGVTADGHPYVISEHVEEKTLADLALSGTTFSTEQAVDVALEICDALSAAHALGIFHAGLSPARIHVALAPGRAPKVKVAGFGDGSGFSAIPFLATESHLPAPEQLRGRTPDARCDVWGVGVLLYTMLAGAPPFSSDDPAALDEAVAREEHASLAGVPDALAVIVDACLAKDSAERPGSIAALADKLAPFSATRRERSTPSLEIIVEADASKPAPPAPKPPPPPERPQMRSVAPVAITVAPPAPAKAAASAPAQNRSRTMIALIAAAACLAAVIYVARRPSTPSAAAPVETATEAPLDVAPSMELNAPPTATATATSTATPTAIATTSSTASATAKATATAKAPAHRATPAATATPTSTPTATPVANPTPATPQPEPKASDDDLRRYLDDRR